MPYFENAGLYPVTGRALFGSHSDAKVIAKLAEGGAGIVQLREKNLSDKDFFELALLYRRETKKHGMILIINDRPDIARLVGADGVHLGLDDLPIGGAREIVGPEAIIGASCHSVEQALNAQRKGASYVNIGPLFPTPTKPDAVTIGLEPARQAVNKLKIPVTVMGGIAEENIDEVLLTGVRHIGVITAIFGAEDIAVAVKRLTKKILAQVKTNG
ncbi:Thiamin-phosphate pyrophosphorylase [hydrothermal vent metagenome]|uniref:thiamine phosphate synthase n=1 Tax=hydrothermal vent metagenome TaxID=652676 RepID=A0A3B1CEZ0_9ZZZZ